MITNPGDLTIAQVNEMLDQLSRVNGEEKQLPIITEFYNKMCAEELMWLIRIILKQMKVGATEKTFFDSWHPDADALFNVSSSLRRVCWELWDPKFRLQDNTKGVNLMSCFQPQLAQFQKKSLDHVVKAIGEKEFWIEEKMDGERMQMHFENGQFRWWSRKAKEYTHLYGSTLKNGSLTRFAKGAFDERVTSIILDGEMVTWDPKLDCIVSFGTLKTAAIETSNNPSAEDIHRPLFRVFDILYLNGNSLLQYPLEDRRKALEGVLNEVERRIEKHPYTIATTVDEIESELRKVIATASEGLVIKNPRSPYRLNERNDDWVKVKPEYMTEFGESLDCLVVGGYWGSGRRGNMLSSYLCGLRVDGNSLPPGADPMKFWSFCKVGGGFTANDYSAISHQTDGYWKKWDSKRPPEWLVLAGGPREFEKPDMWIHPEHSFVVEIKAASVAASDQFRMKQTLRFPRFKKMRPDKNWQTALSVQEFLKLQTQAHKDSQNKSLEVEQRRATRKRIKKEFTVAGGEDAPKFAPLPAVPSGKPLFEGHSFYITSETASRRPKKSKAEIEQLVKAHGGKIFQNETAEPGIHVIGDKNIVKVSALKKNGSYDIISPQWIFDCIRQQELELQAGRTNGYILPLEPAHLFHATDATAEKVHRNIDKWSDSYARDIDMEKLKEVMDNMEGEFDRSLAAPFRDSADLQEIEELDTLPGSIFRKSVVYIDQTVQGVAQTLVDFAGGRVTVDLRPEAGISHIVVGPKTLHKRLQELRDTISTWKGKIPRIVTADWIDESIKEKTLLDEDRFVPAPAVAA